MTINVKMCRSDKASLGKVDPVMALACAVLAQAALDARRGNLGALGWLVGEDCRVYCDVLGIDWEKVSTMAEMWRISIGLREDRPICRRGEIVIQIGTPGLVGV